MRGVLLIPISNRGHLRASAGRLLQGLLAASLVAAASPTLAQAQEASSAGPIPAAQIPDPWVGANRGLYSFSMAVDGVLFAPLVHGYMRVVPAPVRTAIKHAIDNLDEPRIAGNDILQGHLVRAGKATGRFVINSTVGVVGFFDPAADAGLERHDADFGQTLGRYGAGTGPYVFVPLVGPSDIRDGIGRLVDAFGDPISWAAGGLSSTFGQVRDGVYVAQARVDIDDQLTGLHRDFTDPYATLRSAYAQNRAFKIREARGETPAQGVQNLPDFEAAPTPAPPPHP